MKLKKRPRRFFVHIFLLPFALAMIPPFIAFDICVSIFHRISFALCGLKRIKRKPNFKIDEHKIALLDRKERFFALLVLYANGVLSYAKKIVAELDTYWCQPRSVKGGKLVVGKNKAAAMQMMMMQQQMTRNGMKKKKKK